VMLLNNERSTKSHQNKSHETQNQISPTTIAIK
jgi:hypothetical protein